MSAPEIVAPPSRPSIALNRREIKLLTWLIHAVLRGSRDADIQATVTRRPEWSSFCAKVKQLETRVDAQQNVDDEG